MDNLESKKWCWNNNWFVDIVPLENQNGSATPRVRVELHQRTSQGTRLVKIGDKVFEQKTVKNKLDIANEVDRVYELIYNKYNK